MFQDFAYFTGNEVRGGGRGGAMENLGEAYFSRASYFMTNVATGECSPYFDRRQPRVFSCERVRRRAHGRCNKPETQPRLP